MIASAISQLWAAWLACAILHRQAVCKSDACPEPHTFDSSYLTRCPPTILYMWMEAVAAGGEKTDGSQTLCNAIGTEDTNLSMSWYRGREMRY